LLRDQLHCILLELPAEVTVLVPHAHLLSHRTNLGVSMKSGEGQFVIVTGLTLMKNNTSRKTSIKSP
jgi:hypothetical protein